VMQLVPETVIGLFILGRGALARAPVAIASER